MTTTDKMNALADAIESRKNDLARATVAYESAKESHDKALANLFEEFKVSSVEEAEKLLKKLRKRADALYDKAVEALSD